MNSKHGSQLFISRVIIGFGLLILGAPLLYVGGMILKCLIEERTLAIDPFVLDGAMEIFIYTIIPGLAVTGLGTVLRSNAE